MDNTIKSKGLGDDIERVTKALGIKQMFDWFHKKTGIDCGCEERKEYFNKRFNRRRINCLNKEQLVDLRVFFSNFDGVRLNRIERATVARLHAEVFDHKVGNPCSSCSKTWINYINDLKTVYKTYQVKNNEPKN